MAPLWLVPTTAGTGSEVTRWATVWDTDGAVAVKRSLDEPFGYAERAFVDPLLTLSCPPAVTRDTALDALSHALEALWNHHANPLSDGLAVAAAQRIVAALPTCLERPDDVGLRSELALAALEAGMASSQTRTALAHALSYAVTLEQGLSHGLACALWLPTTWRLAARRDTRVDALLNKVFDSAVALEAWLGRVGVPAGPLQLGIADAKERVAGALSSARGRNFIGAS
jgi:alcohol dehydrogenase class IV